MMCLAQRTTAATALISVLALALSLSACGGGGGGGDLGRGLVLLSFRQDSVDNTFLNERLQFVFSESVDPSTISSASIQIREGGAFGSSVPGLFVTSGSSVIFEPRLASLCDQSDSGFKPDTQYRVQLLGFPEEFGIQNMAGQPLSSTSTYEFRTRADTDPDKYADQIPGAGPAITSMSPSDGDQAVAVLGGNKIELVFSENLDPCSVSEETILVRIYELGDPDVFAPNGQGQFSGFSSDGTDLGTTGDLAPLDPTTWGAGGNITSFAAAPVTLLCDIKLEQDFASTRVQISPLFGFANGAAKFPENALIVVTVTYGVEDFGHQPMQPFHCSFTTENLHPSTSTYVIENKGETPYDESLTTAAVHPDPRAPERVQGYMLFAGDGDNGGDPLKPSLPNTPGSSCLTPYQVNDNQLDGFAPTQDVLLDTGASDNTCPNDTDGSNAVVWEFSSFHISNGITVRLIGNNPAIILVQGDVVIDAGGRLSARPDNAGGSPRGDGRTGFSWGYNTSVATAGGTAVAGGGNGGGCPKHAAGIYGLDGASAFGSADGRGLVGGEGAGLGGVSHGSVYPGPDEGSSQGGGGGGHAEAGDTGPNLMGPNHTLKGTAKGNGGAAYPTGPQAERMLTSSAGGGGAGGGNDRWTGSYTSYGTGGGSGAAGGGMVDLTCAGDILIMGTIDASGCKGGNSGAPYTGTNKSGGGGGGGGAGGGIRLLTPNEIILSGTAVVTAAGGPGGQGSTSATAQNNGGAGANGRIVMEDGDSVISGLIGGGASVTPGEGDTGFYRGVFDATRFKGGGLTPQATTLVLPIGNHYGFDPTFMDPVQAYGGQEDFIAGVPVGASPGVGKAAILVEVRGYQMMTDGTRDDASETPWISVGYFTDTGIPAQPSWHMGHPPVAEVPFAPDNAGSANPAAVGFATLNGWGAGGFEFVQFRFTFFLPPSVGPFDPGGYLDDWTLWFRHDQ